MLLLLVLVFELMVVTVESRYVVSDVVGLGRRYDGIGGLSGGGATSRLLVSYPEPYRSQVLDFLFKPNFGASLPILKVEIGGDTQSTAGSEPSHMHSPDDENYQRGYEWWLMSEAKKRNPDIKLYGLPWAFPGWIGEGTQNPFINIPKTIGYILKWIQGAKIHYNLAIDYIGIWNERAFSIPYIKALRAALDAAGLDTVYIVAVDGYQEISPYIITDPDLADAVEIIGIHYPGTHITQTTLETNKVIWSSEDFSTYNDDVGAGCWARLLNQNYVNGWMTSTIAWNLVTSYYDYTGQYNNTSLMVAKEPWSGHYVVSDTIWVTAHTTQFTTPGWKYLNHGLGVQHLDKGGSFVSLTDGKNITIVIETMSHDHSVCIRPALPPYTVSEQTAVFSLQGSYAYVDSLYVWHSQLTYNGQPSSMFVYKGPIKAINGSFSLQLVPDEIYTLTTLPTGIKGSYPTSPPSTPFPVPYSDNFDGYPIFSEADNFADQAGVWEIRPSSDPAHKLAMEQVVLQYPVYSCPNTVSTSTISIIGNYTWENVHMSVDVNISTNAGAFLAHRVTCGSCKVLDAAGLFFTVYTNGTYVVYTNFNRKQQLLSGMHNGIKSGKWFNMELIIQDNVLTGLVEDEVLFITKLNSIKMQNYGFVAIGMPDHASAQFDNFRIIKAS